MDAGEAGPALAPASPFLAARRSPRPRLDGDLLVAVFAGGAVGGGARYAVTTVWPSRPDGFPWSTFAVNVAGAFVLGVVVVLAAGLRPSRYLRPLVGTGFCGGLTTFSSVVVAADELVAHGHAGTAATYLAATMSAGLAAAWAGLVLGRSVVAGRGRGREGEPR